MGKKALADGLLTVILPAFFLLVVLPVLFTLGNALFSGHLSTVLSPDTFSLLWKSVLVAAAVAFLATFFGLLFGFILYKTKIPFSSFFKVTLLIPLFISPYIIAVAWRDLFFLLFHAPNIIASYGGMIFIMILIYTPLAMLVTGNAFVRVNVSLEEAGLMMTERYRVIGKIVLPLMKPAIISSFVLVFIFTVSNFSIPGYLGLQVFTTEIFTQFSAFYDHETAILQSLILIVVCLVLLLSEKRYLADAPFIAVGGKGNAAGKYALNNGKIAAVVLLSGWLLLSVVLPFLVLVYQSFQSGTEKFVTAWKMLSPAVLNSVLLAFSGALIIVITGLAAAYHATSKAGKLFNDLLLFVFAVPSIIFGISLIKFYNHPALGFIYSGFAIILIGYVGKFSFIAAKVTGNAVKQIPRSLDEAARMQGVGKVHRLLKIYLPLLSPALFAAFVLAFIFSFSELSTTIMVYPPGSDILPVKVFTVMANASQALVSSMTLIVFAVTLLLIAVFYILAGKWLKKYDFVYDKT
jgi:ABC-type Fe3+ transport system permease subunit